MLVVFRLELDVVSGHGVGVGSETLGEDRGETPSLVDRLEAFSDDASPSKKPINIHQVLDRVRALAANGVAAQAFVNTFIAGGCAMVVWMFTDWVRTGKVSMVGSLTGVLAGLVAVTPCAGYVPTWAAV